MITLKEALKLSKSEISDLKAELEKQILAKKNLGAYVEQFTNEPLNSLGNGVPVAIKDNIQVKGWSVTSASKILQGYVAPYNATVIEKLLNAGISPFGRTNMDEFAMGNTTQTSFYGRTLNPLDNSRSPGGSSGGSAAAVGAGLAIAALGSDTGGSVRQPAMFCGCVGFKPSYGRVSRYGLCAYSSSLDQIGPITQNVEDAALLYDIIAGYDEKDSTSLNQKLETTADKLDANKKFTICVVKNYIDEANDDVKQILNQGIKKLENLGHKIIYKNLSNSKYDVATYYVIATAEASANLSRFDGVRYGYRASCENLNEMYVKTRSDGFGEEVKRRILLGTFVLSSGYYDAYYVKAQKARAFIKNEYETLLDEADLIYMPVSPVVAPKFGELNDPLKSYLADIYTIGVNLAGLPAICVPIAKNSDGLNVSAQFIGRAYDETSVLCGAYGFEKSIRD